MLKTNTILADFRETRSGIPERLDKMGFHVQITPLKFGDYLINNQIIIERKTKDDFALSLIQKKLFNQIANLKRDDSYCPLLLIEGNPYKTQHEISREALKGALLAINVSWQLPSIYTKDQEDTAETIAMISRQNLKDAHNLYRTGYKPKSNYKKQMYFVQGLPNIGSKLAGSLIETFGSVKKIINLSESDFQKIEGIGKEKSRKIAQFINFEKNRKS